MKSNFYKLVAALVVLIWSTAAHAQLITTIAGNGSAGGWLAWGGPATLCQFNNPIGISIGPDPSGSGNDIYIADSVNNIIRMIDPTGTISVFAGGGTTGLGDGLPAVQAGLNGPTGVASDGGYGVYIADCNNNRIRYVNIATGIITTAVNNTGIGSTGGDGGPALIATVNHPYGVKVVGSNLYIAEKSGNVIRMVDGLGKIHTVAGVVAGYTNDGGPDTAAEFNNPTGLALDGSGNIYIADQGNNVVRKITTAGIISTVAGNHFAGYGGDAGAATLANLTSPTGVAVDASGNLYIADAGNNCIRKVSSPSGIISTFAGTGSIGFTNGSTGSAPGDATFNHPTGVCVSGTTVYVADQGNNVIRKISGGTVSTYSGNGAPGWGGEGGSYTAGGVMFNQPTGITLDGSGNMYIADAANYCVREISVTTGNIFTIAGNPLAPPGDAGDGGAAYPGATLTYPTGVAVDGVGNVFIADAGANRVREVVAGSGTIKGFAGVHGAVGYNGDGTSPTLLNLNAAFGLCFNSAGNLLIADTKDDRIRIIVNVPTPPYTINDMYTFAGNGVRGYGGLATWEDLYGPTNVTVSGAGNMFIADRGNNVVRRVDPKGVMSTYAGTGVWSYTGDGVIAGATNTTYEYPVSVAFYNGGGTAGLLFVGDANNHVVRMIDPATGTSVLYAGQPGVSGNSGDGGPATATGGLGCELGYIGGIEVDQSNGDLYIVDQSNGVVRKASGTVPSHTMSTVAGTGIPGYLASGGPATSCMLTNPYSIATDTFGGGLTIFVADRDNHVIRKIDNNGIISVYAGTGFPGYLDGVAATTAQLSSPDGVALDTLGNLYISDMGNNRIRKVTKSTGMINTIIGSGTIGTVVGSALGTQMYYPDGVAADRFGNLFIADGNNNRVLKYNGTSVTIFAGTGVAGYTGVGGPAAGAELNDPKGVHIDGGGNVYIADFLNNCVRKVDATSGNITTIAGTTSPGATGDGGPATAATMSLPASVAMDSSHSLLIADFGNNVIRRVNSAGIIINVAGNYTAGYSGDGGQATAAQLSSPVGIQVDSAGSFYIADRNNNVVRKVTEVLLAEYDTTTVTDLCQDSCLRLTNTSIGSTDSILWTVSPAGPSFYSSPRLDTPTLCFTSSPAGTYAISLTIYYHGNSKTFTHNIIIKPTPIPTITQTGSTLSTGGVGSGYYNYQWYNGTTAIPGATSSTLTWYPSPGAGSYKVKVDSNGCSGYSTVVNIVTTAVTKVNLPDNNKYWLAQGADNSVVNIYAAHAIDAPLTVTMFDATGREILSDMWDKGLNTIQIKAASLPPGMYLVKLTNSNTSQVLKWVKN